MAVNFKDRSEIMVVSPLNELVPENHLVRKLDRYIDWSFIYPLTDPLYSTKGRGRIDPVILFKMIFINKLFGINSMRKTCEEIKVNVAYRWFLHLSFEDKVPDHSTYSQNYRRKYKDNHVSQKIFEHILSELINYGLIDIESLFIDGTHVKAHANKNKYNKQELIVSSAKAYQKELEAEINHDRHRHGKKALTFNETTGEVKQAKVSKNDPESGVFHKGEKEKCFAYSINTACDKHGYIVGAHIEPGNVHDAHSFFPLYQKLKMLEDFEDIRHMVLDAGYIAPYICKVIMDDSKLPLMPYKSPMTKKGYFKKYEYVYDEAYDCYLCPNDKVLKYSTTNRDGYRLYKSNPNDCKQCPFIHQCTSNKKFQKVITRHVWDDYKEETVHHIRHSDVWKEVYPQRKVTIERCFADAKTKHGMGFTRYIGKQRVFDDILLLFSAMNTKKMVNYLDKIHHNNHLYKLYSTIFQKIEALASFFIPNKKRAFKHNCLSTL
jgi:transposase